MPRLWNSRRSVSKSSTAPLLCHGKPPTKKYYIGLSDGTRPESFVRFWPKKNFVWLRFDALSSAESWLKRLEDAELYTEMANEGLRVKLTPKDFDENKELLTELLQAAAREYENG